MRDVRSATWALVAGLEPWDDQERDDRAAAMEWIESDNVLYRASGAKQRLCVYVVLFSHEARKLLLIDHVNTGLTLPAGGHVEPDEDPRSAARRECHEELGVSGSFHRWFDDQPAFLHRTPTHADKSAVALWFVMDRPRQITPDPREIAGTHWVPLDRPAEWPARRYEPAMERFRAKLAAFRR